MCPKKGVFKSQGKTNAENQYRKYKNLSIYIMKDFSVKAIWTVDWSLPLQLLSPNLVDHVVYPRVSDLDL